MIYTYINSKQQDQPKIDKTNATESINFNAPLFTICFAAGQQSKNAILQTKHQPRAPAGFRNVKKTFAY